MKRTTNGIGWVLAAVCLVGIGINARGAALTVERDTPTREGSLMSVGIYTNTRIFAGAMVALNAGGYAIPAADSASLNVIGRAEKTVDNRVNATGAGDSGTFNVSVRRGVFRWVNGDTFTDADIGELAFVEDDQTVQKAAAASADIIAGVVVDVDSDGVWVDTYDIGAQGASAPSTLAVAGAATVGTTLDVAGRLTVTDADGASDVASLGYEGSDAKVTLDADQGDDAADTWILESEAADNDFTLNNHTTEILKITTGGDATIIGGVTITDADGAATFTATGYEGNDAVLVLDADQGDDNADTWSVESEAADNDLSFVNHTTEAFKITAAGDAKSTGDLHALGGNIYIGTTGDFRIGNTTQLWFVVAGHTNVIDADITK